MKTAKELIAEKTEEFLNGAVKIIPEDDLQSKRIQFDDAKLAQYCLPLIQSKLPTRFKNAGYNVSRFEKINQGGSYIFLGGVGTGKTYAMYEIINSFTYMKIKKQVSELLEFSNIEIKPEHIMLPKLYTTIGISITLKEEFETKPQTSLIERMVKTPILFIDDLGVEKPTEWWLEQFSYVVNERYNWNLPMVLSTNLDFKSGEFARFYGDRIASRIGEMCDMVLFSGSDKRLNKV